MNNVKSKQGMSSIEKGVLIIVGFILVSSMSYILGSLATASKIVN